MFFTIIGNWKERERPLRHCCGSDRRRHWNAHHLQLLCFALHEDDLRRKTCRLEAAVRAGDQLASLLEVTVVVPWLGQHPQPQEIYPLPTDDGNTLLYPGWGHC